MTKLIVRYVGLDVHKRTIVVCIVDFTGKVLHRETFALTRRTLLLFASKVLRRTDQVALEATTNCWAVADVLRPHVARVMVSNPMATKAIAQAKVKTDKVDAHVLAQLLRCDFLPEVWAPDEHTRQLRELVGRRSRLVRQRTRIRNRIHSVLAMRLIEASPRLFNAEGLDWLATLELDEQGRVLLDSDLRQLKALAEELAGFDRELARRGYASAEVKLLMTLPGIDSLTAEGMLAAWGDYRRFPDGDHAASYLGITSRTKQSADHCYHGPITKQGNSEARWMLIEAAQHLDTNPGPLGHFFRRLLKKKNRNVAVVAAARKLAVIGWKMLMANEPYRYALPRSTESKLSRLRLAAAGPRRKTGTPKGIKAEAKLPGGALTIRSLAEVYQLEGLPAPQALPSGETRTIAQTGCQSLVDQISQRQLVPRQTSKAKTTMPHEKNPTRVTTSDTAALPRGHRSRTTLRLDLSPAAKSEGKGGQHQATHPSPLAPRSALGSVPTGALSSAESTSLIRRLPSIGKPTSAVLTDLPPAP